MEMMVGWRWCDQCQGLWQAAYGGPCPAGGQHHSGVGSLHYGLWGVNGGELPPLGYQGQWKWCNKCQAMFYGPNQGSSTCPAGGNHDGTVSGDYALATGSAAGQGGWNWCSQCQVLFYGPNQGSSHCPATHGAHDPTGSASYTVPNGPFPEELNVIVQQRDAHYICLVSSPDGSVGHMGVAHPEVFGTANNNASGGVIAVCQTPFRTFYACRSNDDSSVMLGSVGISRADITPPVSTGLQIIGDNSDPNASAPALAYFQGTLYLFYRTWYQNKWGYGPVQCLPITVTDGAGHFTVGASVTFGDIDGGGRITAVATKSQLWCSWFQPTNPNANGIVSAAFSSDGKNWSSKSLGKTGNSGSPALLVLPSGQMALGWRGPNNGLYYSLYHPEGGGYWAPASSTPVPGVTLLGEPCWMGSADNASVYVAARGVNDGIRLYKLGTGLDRVLESGDVPGIVIRSTPALLCLFSDGEPPDPPD